MLYTYSQIKHAKKHTFVQTELVKP